MGECGMLMEIAVGSGIASFEPKEWNTEYADYHGHYLVPKGLTVIE